MLVHLELFRYIIAMNVPPLGLVDNIPWDGPVAGDGWYVILFMAVIFQAPKN